LVALSGMTKVTHKAVLQGYANMKHDTERKQILLTLIQQSLGE